MLKQKKFEKINTKTHRGLDWESHEHLERNFQLLPEQHAWPARAQSETEVAAPQATEQGHCRNPVFNTPAPGNNNH